MQGEFEILPREVTFILFYVLSSRIDASIFYKEFDDSFVILFVTCIN